jgi:hypothetical protein
MSTAAPIAIVGEMDGSIRAVIVEIANVRTHDDPSIFAVARDGSANVGRLVVGGNTNEAVSAARVFARSINVHKAISKVVRTHDDPSIFAVAGDISANVGRLVVGGNINEAVSAARVFARSINVHKAISKVVARSAYVHAAEIAIDITVDHAIRIVFEMGKAIVPIVGRACDIRRRIFEIG